MKKYQVDYIISAIFCVGIVLSDNLLDSILCSITFVLFFISYLVEKRNNH